MILTKLQTSISFFDFKCKIFFSLKKKPIFLNSFFLEKSYLVCYPVNISSFSAKTNILSALLLVLSSDLKASFLVFAAMMSLTSRLFSDEQSMYLQKTCKIVGYFFTGCRAAKYVAFKDLTVLKFCMRNMRGLWIWMKGLGFMK